MKRILYSKLIIPRLALRIIGDRKRPSNSHDSTGASPLPSARQQSPPSIMPTPTRAMSPSAMFLRPRRSPSELRIHYRPGPPRPQCPGLVENACSLCMARRQWWQLHSSEKSPASFFGLPPLCFAPLFRVADASATAIEQPSDCHACAFPRYCLPLHDRGRVSTTDGWARSNHLLLGNGDVHCGAMHKWLWGATTPNHGCTSPPRGPAHARFGSYRISVHDHDPSANDPEWQNGTTRVSPTASARRWHGALHGSIP